jgi:hypothetical protein
MRTLKEIKKAYLLSCDYDSISIEERREYNITEDKLKKWRTEYVMEKGQYFTESVEDLRDNIGPYSDEKLFDDIFYYFAERTTDFMTEEFIYSNIIYIFEMMYECEYFDIFTFDIEAQNRIAELRQKPKNGEIIVKIYEGREYTGIIPNLYYSNHPDILDKVLKYFCNVVYQKYGLYLQKAMNVLIEFFNKYDQKYVQLLLDSKESAKKLDYPSNHKFKYCYRKLLDLKWE